MLTELREGTEIYTQNLEPDIRIRKDNSVGRLREIFRSKEDIILAALPSIRRVQVILGNAENLDPDVLYQNVVYDMRKFMGFEKAEEITQVALNTLRQAEIALQWDFIFNSPYPIKELEDPETAISLREKIIAETVWRSFNRSSGHSKDDPAVKLIKQVKGNMHYLRYRDLNEIKAAPLSSPFEEDTNDEKFSRLNRLVYHSANGNYISPSAETCYIIAENKSELLSLAYQTSPILLQYLTGATIEELARQENKSEELITQTLKEDAEKVSEYGAQNYNWTTGFSAYVASSFPERKRKHETEYLIPTDSDWTALLARNRAGLPQIMSVIGQLPKFQQMCILFHWHYLDANLNAEEWIILKKVSKRLYQTTLHRAYKAFEKYLPSAGYPKRSIKEIVEGCKDYQVTKSATGRTLNEASQPLRIKNLAKNHFPPGTFTRNEQKIITYITDYYTEHHNFPNGSMIAKHMNLREITVDDLMAWMLETKPDQARFADKNSCIARNTFRFQLIRWYKNNCENPETILQLSHLSPLQKQTFDLAVTLDHGYYRTNEQISEELKINKEISKRIQIIFKSLNNSFSVAKFRDNLTSQITTKETDLNMARRAYIKRINSGLPISSYEVSGEIAKELEISADVVRHAFIRAAKP